MADTSGRSDSSVPSLIDTGGCRMTMTLPPPSRRESTVPADLNIGDEVSLIATIGLYQVTCVVKYIGLDHQCNCVIKIGEVEYVVSRGWAYAVKIENVVYRIFSVNRTAFEAILLDIELRPTIVAC